MLQSIRDKSQGWLAWTIVTAVCVTFALWGIHSYLYSGSAKNVVAKVNGTKITQPQLTTLYNQLRFQQQMRFGRTKPISQESSKRLKATALETLISSLVLTNAALSDGFRAAPELVEATIAKMPLFQIKGEFSPSRFQQVISHMLYSQDQFFAELQNNLLVNQVKIGMIQTAFVLPNEVSKTIALINQKRTFGYALLDANQFLPMIKVRPETLVKYYKEHLDEFKTPEKVSLEYLELSVPQLMKKIHPSDDQLRLYYQNHIASYTQKQQFKLASILIPIPPAASKDQIKSAEKKIVDIAAQLKKGADFIKLMNKYSDNSPINLDALPYVASEQLDPSIRKELTHLTKIGSLSEPIQTNRGYVILKVIDIKAKKMLPFDEVKHKVLQAYQQQKAEKQFTELSDQLANITYENPNDLQHAGKELKLNILTTNFFTKESGVDQITKNPKVISAVFSDEVLNQGNNSDPINIRDDYVVVLRIKQHQPTSVKTYKTVERVIIDKLRHNMAEKGIKTTGENLLKKIISTNQSAKTIIEKNNLTWHVINNATRRIKTVNPEILDAVFKAPLPTQKTPVVTQGFTLPSGNFAIIALTKVKNASSKNLTKEKYRIFNQGVKKGIGLLDYQLYFNGLLNKAKIKRYLKSKE